MTITILTNIEVEVEVSGTYDKEKFNPTTGLLEEQASLTDVKVLLRKSNQVIDITDALPGGIILELQEQLAEEFLRNEH